MRIAIVLFDLLILYLLTGQSLIRRLAPRSYRIRAALKDYERLFRHVLRADRDVMPAQRLTRLQAAVAEVRAARRARDRVQTEALLADLHERSHELVPRPRGGWCKEYFEVFAVVLAVVFGFRSLFLQPFKIPTGSMQPTLYGIHFVHQQQVVMPRPVGRFFQWLNYSRRYVDAVVTRAGYLEEIRSAKPAIPFFPVTVVRIGGVEYRLPGKIETVLHPDYCRKISRFTRSGRSRIETLYFAEGEVLARGCLELGDHLFVDRVSLSFREPRRGDITVFLTDGITDMDGGGLGGRYYIKRLAGLPGDEIRIQDHRLFVRQPGETDFRLVDESVSPAFPRIYGFTGGYRGYCHYAGSRYLLTPEDTFTVPADQYFMLGDNSENSKDSRFWGTVPRANLLGRACVVWWPFSRRWGTTDRVEPVDSPTPPTRS